MTTGELILIRHGKTDSPGRLNGRTDVGLSAQPGRLKMPVATVWTSPARRARQTGEALFPGVSLQEDARLWEQDFGSWDGMAYAELPDLGDLSRAELADLKSDGGESFRDMVRRVRPAVEVLAETALSEQWPVVIVAHAGTVRAALACATGDVEGALAFEIDHLRATRLRCYSGGLAVTSVNEALA